MAPSFQLELEHLVSQEASRSIVLSGTAGIDVPSLSNFLEILSGYGSKYDSDDTSYYSPRHECLFLSGKAATTDATDLMPSDMSPTS